MTASTQSLALTPLGPMTWADVAQHVQGIDTWFWCDSRKPGWHLESALPDVAPPDCTHVWGWTRRAVWVRLRIDSAGPGGVTGALLSAGGASAGPLVTASVVEARTWAQGDGRVAARLGEVAGAPARLLLVPIPDSANDRVLAHLEFFELGEVP